MRKETVIAGAVAVATAATTSVFALAPAASAAECRKSVIEYTGYRGPNTYQTVTKGTTAQSSCRDLNVIESLGSDNERFAGFFQLSNGTWQRGSRGYVPIADGTQSPWVVLLSDVRGGTKMSVGSWNTEGDWVYLAY